MKAWRVLLALSFVLLSGCLVTFNEPIPTNQPAPKALLGKWTSTNAWGEPMNLELTRLGNDRYQAVTYFKAKPHEREAYPFTVSRHGNRWYLSAKVPAQYGGHFTIAGFELTDKHELVVYNLDLDAQGRLRKVEQVLDIQWMNRHIAIDRWTRADVLRAMGRPARVEKVARFEGDVARDIHALHLLAGTPLVPTSSTPPLAVQVQAPSKQLSKPASGLSVLTATSTSPQVTKPHRQSF